MKKKELGALGEKAARAFLEKRGYKVLETNFRSREGLIQCQKPSQVLRGRFPPLHLPAPASRRTKR